MLAGFYMEISRSSLGTRRGRLRFLVTSRPYDDIRVEFQKTLDFLPAIRLRGKEENNQINQEINLVIRKRVEKLAEDLQLDSQTKNQLEVKLLEMEHRTYLWLYLAIGSIYETFRDAIRPEEASIELIPSTVEEGYQKILTRISKKQGGNVKKIFEIVIGARRPLTIQEMAIALGIATAKHPNSLREAKLNPNHLENNIRHWCVLFIFINRARIYLIHQTAKEFLIGDGGSTPCLSGWKHCLDPRKIEKEMTRICIEFLCLQDIRPVAESLLRKSQHRQEIYEVLDKNDDAESFLVYTAECWHKHFRDANMPIDESNLAQISQLYDTDSALYRLWSAIYWKIIFFGKAPKMNSIHLASMLGDEKVLEWMLQSNQHSDINASDEHGRTPLECSSRGGHVKVVQMLLDSGADVNTKIDSYRSALEFATLWGHEKIVQILVDNKADIQHTNALYLACMKGRAKIVKILIDSGVDVDSAETHEKKKGHTPLQVASTYGYTKIVKMLVDAGANINSGSPSTPELAKRKGHMEVVQILSDAKAAQKRMSMIY